MKKLSLITISFFLITSIINASELNYERNAQSEQTLIQGLISDNIGLQVSSATLLGELKSEQAVNHLSAVLRNSKDDRARRAAALSLAKIGTKRSLFVIKQAVRFNSSPNVRAICSKLNNAVNSKLQYDVDKSSFVAKN